MRLRSASRRVLLLVLVIASVSVFALPAVAAETANSDFVIIREDDVIADDLYAGAIRVLVEGRIDGDLIAFAAEEVVINGSVGGSVVAVTPRVVLSGSVDGSLRTVAGSVSVEGTVEGDLVATGLDVELGPDSVVNGEVLAWVWSLQSLGRVGELSGTQRTLELGGSVETDVDVSVGRLRIIEPLIVGGDLGYRSENEAEGLDQATVGGVVVDKDPLPPNIRVRALGSFTRFLAVLFLTFAALAVSWGWPDRTGAAIKAVRLAPLRSWGTGALFVFSPLILAGVAALIVALAPAAASFPLLAVLAPVTLAMVGAVGAASLVAGVPAVGWVGAKLLPERSVHAAVLFGSLIVGAFWFLPVLTWLIPIVVLPLGLGAWARSWRLEPTGSDS
jgi:cytoskeletal protein CcmA (bactofilin family)